MTRRSPKPAPAPSSKISQNKNATPPLSHFWMPRGVAFALSRQIRVRQENCSYFTVFMTLINRMKLKTLVARLALVWILLAQMFYVCLAANTTVSLSRLESNYAFSPSADHKAALDNEFDRVASYESHRAIARFTLLLALDVALIALFWNFGVKRKPAAEQPTADQPHPLPGQLSAS
jgi:hypothetical protein